VEGDNVRVVDDGSGDGDGQWKPARRWWIVAATAFGLSVAVALLVVNLPSNGEPTVEPLGAVPAAAPKTPPDRGVPSDPFDIRGCEVSSAWIQVCDTASFDGTAMYAVTAGGPGLVAVGANGLDYSTPGGVADPGGYEQAAPTGATDAVVWTSLFGFTWTRVPHDGVTFGGVGGQQMFGVTVGGPGLVAVGRDGPVVDGEGDAAVWTSSDGFTWSRVPHDEDVFGGEGEQRMVSVTVGGPGLVAIGFDRGAQGGEGDAAVWTSSDGFTWSRVPHDEVVFGGESQPQMLSLTAGGPGLVAVGTDGYPYVLNFGQLDGSFDEPADELAVDAAVWTSTDGFTWSRVPHDEAIFGGEGEQRMVSVAVGGPGVVAVGSVTGDLGRGWHTFDAAVWTSADGINWSRVQHDVAVFAASGDLGDAEEQMLSVAASGPGLVAVGFDSAYGCGWDSAVWTSTDGFTWSRVPDVRNCDADGPYDRMLSVTVGPTGLVAVGEEHSPGAAAVWNS
jgi:hypothetical protein